MGVLSDNIVYYTFLPPFVYYILFCMCISASVVAIKMTCDEGNRIIKADREAKIFPLLLWIARNYNLCAITILLISCRDRKISTGHSNYSREIPFMLLCCLGDNGTYVHNGKLRGRNFQVRQILLKQGRVDTYLLNSITPRISIIH